MRNVLLLISAFFFTVYLSGQNDQYQLSTHILDITEGKPAAKVEVMLEKQNGDAITWNKVDDNLTDENGRIGTFLQIGEGDQTQNEGVYRLTFFTKQYFENRSVKTFYPFIQVVFEIKGEGHYHVPITLSPYGYSTYRGS